MDQVVFVPGAGDRGGIRRLTVHTDGTGSDTDEVAVIKICKTRSVLAKSEACKAQSTEFQEIASGNARRHLKDCTLNELASNRRICTVRSHPKIKPPFLLRKGGQFA